MPETKRAVRPASLDTASDHLGEMLRRADELLLEWSKFGAGVRAQVDREAQNIGNAVCDAVDLAVRRAAADGTSRAITEQLGVQLAAVSAEVAKLEARARAASRAIAEQRRGDRVLLYALIAAVLIANALLVVGLLREPAAPVVEAPIAKPIEPEPKVLAPAVIDDAGSDAAGSAAPTEPADVLEHEGTTAPKAETKPGTDAKAVKPELKAVPPLRPVKQGAPTGGRAATRSTGSPGSRD